MSAGRGACDVAIGDANADAGNRGVEVAYRSILAEVDARGTGVGYSSVVGGKVGWVRGGRQQEQLCKQTLVDKRS